MRLMRGGWLSADSECFSSLLSAPLVAVSPRGTRLRSGLTSSFGSLLKGHCGGSPWRSGLLYFGCKSGVLLPNGLVVFQDLLQVGDGLLAVLRLNLRWGRHIDDVKT